jgi:hypothetical protein
MKERLLKKGEKRKPSLKKKKSVIIAAKKDISLESVDRLKLIMRRRTI